MDEKLQSEIESADPVGEHDDAKLHDLVRRMTAEARDAARAVPPAHSPSWKRRRILIPFGIVGVPLPPS